MEPIFKILGPADLKQIAEVGERFLAVRIQNPIERRLASWHVKWRAEALEHYLKLGWSFAQFGSSGDEMKGFFLGQPLLFFRGQTQTLWIECLECDSDETSRNLIEVAVKLGREKHLQRVLFHDVPQPDLLAAWKALPLPGEIWEVKTTKG